MAMRLSDLALLELQDGSRYLLSPKDPGRLVQAATRSMDSGPPSRVGGGAESVDAKALAFLAAFSSALLYVHGLLPEVVPLHYGARLGPGQVGTKGELMTLQIVFLVVGSALLVTFAVMCLRMRELVGISLPIVPVIAGLGYVMLAIEFMALPI